MRAPPRVPPRSEAENETASDPPSGRCMPPKARFACCVDTRRVSSLPSNTDLPSRFVIRQLMVGYFPFHVLPASAVISVNVAGHAVLARALSVIVTHVRLFAGSGTLGNAETRARDHAFAPVSVGHERSTRTRGKATAHCKVQRCTTITLSVISHPWRTRIR
jgi:hypothetical protein